MSGYYLPGREAPELRRQKLQDLNPQRFGQPIFEDADCVIAEPKTESARSWNSINDPLSHSSSARTDEETGASSSAETNHNGVAAQRSSSSSQDRSLSTRLSREREVEEPLFPAFRPPTRRLVSHGTRSRQELDEAQAYHAGRPRMLANISTLEVIASISHVPERGSTEVIAVHAGSSIAGTLSSTASSAPSSERE